jgi:hypothetical protein
MFTFAHVSGETRLGTKGMFDAVITQSISCHSGLRAKSAQNAGTESVSERLEVKFQVNYVLNMISSVNLGDMSSHGYVAGIAGRRR